MKIFSGTNYKSLSESLIVELKKSGYDIEIGQLKIDKFSDGEILPCFKESIRDLDVFFINSSDSSDSIMETLLVVDAAKRAGCKSFTLVSPYSGYSRQDKTDHLRSSIGSKLLSDMFEKAGVNRLLTIDLHSSSIQGFYNFPVIHLNGNVVSIDYIKSLSLDNLCIVAPDQGAVKRASDFCKAFPDATFALINKKRVKPNEIHSMELVGEVVGKNIIIVDDMADTLGTMAKASELLIQNGAVSVRCVATHGILSGNSLINLKNSKIEEVIVIDTLDSVYQKSEKFKFQFGEQRIKIISCARLLAKSILALIEKKSIHEINNI
jgi:ribose-phosphate pyrophosphokinase